jgi:hypothetical protein
VGTVNCVKTLKAYVPQQPWLMNKSIRDNIVFDSPDTFDKARCVLYVWRRVCVACLPVVCDVGCGVVCEPSVMLAFKVNL